MSKYLDKLIVFANKLDSVGLYNYANQLDNFIIKMAEDPKIDIKKALRSASIYWKNLNLDRYKDQISKALQTSALPNTEEFIKAVSKYQQQNPDTQGVDGMLGPLTLKSIVGKHPDLFPQTPQTQTIQKQPQQQMTTIPKDTEELKQKVEDLGLVNLKNIAPIKNYPFAHPNLAHLLKNIEQVTDIKQVTEAYPPTVPRRESDLHNKGKAIDITLTNIDEAQKLTDFINRSPGFRAINEYARPSEHATGGHIHIQMT